LTDSIENEITNVICISKFGIDKYNISSKKDRAYYEKLVLSKRMALLQLLKNEMSIKAYEKLLEEGVTPYESVRIADEYDYTHQMTWKNEIKITRDIFRNVPYKKWCKRFVEECERTTDSLSRSDCGLQFARIIVELSEEQFNKVIASLRLIPDSILVNILYEMRSNREKIPSKRGLVNVCVDILDDLLKCENTRNALSKAIFELLSSIDIQDELVVQRTIESIVPWLEATIDDGQAFSGEHHILSNLINNGDFYKITVLINSYVTLK
jgi:hypothetical protein